VLLRDSYRDEDGRSRKRTLANLSKLPRDMVDTLNKGGTVIGTGPGNWRSSAPCLVAPAMWRRCWE